MTPFETKLIILSIVDLYQKHNEWPEISIEKEVFFTPRLKLVSSIQKPQSGGFFVYKYLIDIALKQNAKILQICNEKYSILDRRYEYTNCVKNGHQAFRYDTNALKWKAIDKNIVLPRMYDKLLYGCRDEEKNSCVSY